MSLPGMPPYDALVDKPEPDDLWSKFAKDEEKDEAEQMKKDKEEPEKMEKEEKARTEREEKRDEMVEKDESSEKK